MKQENTSSLPWSYIFGPTLLAIILYLNTLSGEFVYDDNRAILTNPDVLQQTSLFSLFYNDFWGTSLSHFGSHGSYRPLCVLTFRLNHVIHQLNPLGYHLVNILLHSAVTALFIATIWRVIPSRRVAVISGFLFASHSVHTEAVAGVVGRAELLSAFFFLCAINYYMYMTSHSVNSKTHSNPAQLSHSNSTSSSVDIAAHKKSNFNCFLQWIGFVVLSLLAIMSKEQGIMVCGMAMVWSILHKVPSVNGNFSFLNKIKHLFNIDLIILFSITILLGLFRCHMMEYRQPEFSSADNPAASSYSTLSRTLTFLYLPAVNFGLLMSPVSLSFDWSMDSIPLIESLYDSRVIIIIVFYFLLIAFVVANCVFALKISVSYSGESYSNDAHTNGHRNAIRSPDLNAAQKVNSSNDDFHVNDSSSDRSLSSFNNCNKKESELNLKRNGATIKSSALSSCYYSISSNPILPHVTLLSKSHNGQSTSTSQSSNYNNKSSEASGKTSSLNISSHSSVAAIFAVSLLVVPFIPASNLFFYVGFVVAERVLYTPSMGYCLLVALGFDSLYKYFCGCKLTRYMLNALMISSIFCLSLKTIQRNNDWLTEYNLYLSGTRTNPAKAWGNLGNVLRADGKLQAAEEAYKKSLLYRPNMADVHYNLGILYQNEERHEEAVQSYRHAIRFRPNLTPALLNLGLVYISLGQYEHAEEMFRLCNSTRTSEMKDPRLHEHSKISCLYHLGRSLADRNHVQKAVSVYKEAISRLVPDFPAHSLYNMLGEAYFKLDNLLEAERFYKKSLQIRSDHIPAHLTMARLYQRLNQNDIAEDWFKKAELLSPDDTNVLQFYGYFLGEMKRYSEAAEYYFRAAEKLPSNFEVLSNVANMLRESGRSSDAEDFYRKAVNIKPNEITAVINLGAILHYNGKLKEAEKVYLKGLKLNQNDSTLKTNLDKLRRLIAKQNL